MRADHLDFVVAAYAVAIVTVGFMVARTLRQSRRLRRALERFQDAP
jgi:heme exporter protein CcmD